ncbi:MAG: serine hydrolase domain-containing protein [Litorimonas sp.]
MRLRLLPLLLALFAAPAAAQDANEVNIQELDRRARVLMGQTDMTGMAIAVVEDGAIRFAKGYGTPLRGSGLQVDADTVFRWASVSKGVGAAVLLDAVEDGLVDPQIPVETLAPSLALPPTQDKHDVVDLLSHRIGIPRNAYDGKIEDGQAAKTVRSELGELTYVCPPRTCHTYQNAAFDAAAEIVEEATELPYKALVQTQIFDPAGMTSASVTLDGLTGSRNWARPHGRRGQRISRVKPTYYRVPAAAGVNSSVEDLARWMIALMPSEDDSGPIPNARLDAMQTPVVPTPREQRMMNRRFQRLKNSHYGLGLRVYDYEGRKVVGHRGGVEGYRALILFDPELRSGIAMMWNSPHSQPIGMQLEYLDQLYGLPRRDWLKLNGDRS